MTTPHILYHGTTILRWALGIDKEGLRGDMPRQFLVDERHKGYVFLTGSLNEAAFYSLMTLQIDNELPIVGKMQGTIPTTNSGTILAVRTSSLQGVEVDPEGVEQKLYFAQQGLTQECERMGFMHDWYRYNGNIPRKLVMPYKAVPASKQSPELLKFFKEYRETCEVVPRK